MATDAITATELSSDSDNKKIDDLEKDTVLPTDQDRITSEFGVRQANTDNWLSASTADKKGPALLEDQFAREKVCHSFQRLIMVSCCSRIGSHEVPWLLQSRLSTSLC